MGHRIKKLRLELDCSFDALVGETELGRGYISELERGLVVPSLTALSKIAKALDLTIADLVLGRTERELVFDELRHLPVPQIKRLLVEVRLLRREAKKSDHR